MSRNIKPSEQKQQQPLQAGSHPPCGSSATILQARSAYPSVSHAAPRVWHSALPCLPQPWQTAQWRLPPCRSHSPGSPPRPQLQLRGQGQSQGALCRYPVHGRIKSIDGPSCPRTASAADRTELHCVCHRGTRGKALWPLGKPWPRKKMAHAPPPLPRLFLMPAAASQPTGKHIARPGGLNLRTLLLGSWHFPFPLSPCLCSTSAASEATCPHPSGILPQLSRRAVPCHPTDHIPFCLPQRAGPLRD